MVTLALLSCIVQGLPCKLLQPCDHTSTLQQFCIVGDDACNLVMNLQHTVLSDQAAQVSDSACHLMVYIALPAPSFGQKAFRVLSITVCVKHATLP